MIRVFVIAGMAAAMACSNNRPELETRSEIEHVVIVGVDRMTPASRRSLLDSATRARERWKHNQPRSYELRVVERSGCLEVRTNDTDPPTRLVYRVVADSIHSSRAAPFADSLRAACWPRFTVDSLFGRIFASLRDSASTLSEVVFDPRYGFPRSFVQDHCYGCSHGRTRIGVEYFVVTLP
jgi:hypothetical protein